MELDDAKVQQLQNQPNEGDFQLQVLNNQNDVMVQIVPPKGEKRTPLDICCVVDTSGSMGSAASVGKDAEQTGLSILDIVKHALKTVIHNLEDQDNLSIVRFDDQASIQLKMTNMDKKGKNQAQTSVEALNLGGCTNLWDGLKTGLDLIRDGSINKNTAVMVFTDGVPNVDPPRGYIPTLQKYLDEHGQICQIHTFGFGYSLNSKLLNQISQVGNGNYSFIPDAGMVGTVFINAISNLLSTVATNAMISLEPQNGAALLDQDGIKGYQCQKASWGLNVFLGTIQFEQSRNVAFKLDLKNHKPDTPYLYVKFKYQSVDPQYKETLNLEVEQMEKNNGNAEELETHLLRNKFIQVVENMVKTNISVQDAKKILEDLKQDFKKSQAFQNKGNTYLQDIYKDIEGEVCLAYEKQENLKRWGQHYLPSLINAHLVQQQNNFKDHGVQHYGGKLFNKIRDEAEKSFVKLPPPKPSRVTYGYNNNNNNNNNNQGQPTFKKINMAQYNNRGGVCFAKGSLVLMSDGSEKKVEEIQKGDRIQTGGNLVKSVECVVESLCEGGEADMVQLENGLLLTTHHPVKNSGQWVFPVDIAGARKVKSQSVYSFLLKERDNLQGENTIIVNGIEAATLAHGVRGKVIEHKYFGSERIVSDLKKIKGWERGHIILKENSLIRCEKTTLIKGLNISKNNQEISI
ncbi:hypothetical protein PPERSA_08870 [Pseudocohnilembus persalinus]|uniref:VWFA domain-containing protein n=1 Tax=Pseudocohnilembus persalinus TaxID=266149 RepID=A0A0V0R3V4_PSEPJ|nr:hypothetical protein PPERSA_08870 [Pseudocohnilembus persalinus]|eukprot:KRX09154.1 hypothetical protein PPERSA_08870 [Pseudocohnilembus persalinus]